LTVQLGWPADVVARLTEEAQKKGLSPRQRRHELSERDQVLVPPDPAGFDGLRLIHASVSAEVPPRGESYRVWQFEFLCKFSRDGTFAIAPA
jgi:hypothetical protein